MTEENKVKELVTILSQSRIVVSGDVEEGLLKGIELDILASRIIDKYKESTQLNVISSEEIKGMISGLAVEKAPMPIEVIRSGDFKPVSAEIDANYQTNIIPNEHTEGTALGFVEYFKSRLRKLRAYLESHGGSVDGLISNLGSLKSLASGREVTVIGIVTAKSITKNGHTMVILEDEEGSARVLFMSGTSDLAKSLLSKASTIVNDEVLAIKGKISGPFVIANDVIWPDVPIKDRKKIEDDLAIAFMSDVHVGSKRFMDKNFSHMIQWLNGNIPDNKELAGKIKYIVIAGDVVDGIGIYPGHETDLAMFDIYTQYKELFRYLSAIPDYIHIFLMPGNHDAVQRAEPQPPPSAEILSDFSKSNIHVLSNPSYLSAHGLDILAYHGTSLDSIISAIPGMSYAHPEKAMVELLKRRHISPIYGGNVVVPTKEDNLVISKIPDILHMGHIHKNGLTNYHGVEIVNSGTWQARTDFQIRQGHIPTPCILPVYEMKSRNFTTVNFGGDEGKWI
ncbi:MAG: DNA-directed DNA polymerase II small subunit [Candidatus Marsarchaeota archaeon]|nr:DNA-directed DNA polymerase II small subunit [Candidatus Marsarchaeota archaeon]